MKRRENLINSLNDGELVLIFANEEATGANRFLQNSNFYYFTGLNTPEAILLMGKINGKSLDEIFIQRNIPERIVWDGEKIYPIHVTLLTGINLVLFIEDFEKNVVSHLTQFKKVYINCGVVGLNQPLNKSLLFIDKLKQRVPHLEIQEVSPIIRPLRQIKDELEIEALTQSIKITWEGIKSIWQNARAGMKEYELEAMLHYEMQKQGCRNFGFVPIIAAGENAATLHYIDNNTTIEDNQLVLLDVGASHENYSADISRTFPVNGKFTDRQKEVYQEVLNIQKEIISMVKPGISMVDLNAKTRELMFAAMMRLGLITEEKDVIKYYMHSIGHHLGLDVHDVGTRDSILEEGMVITVEPGIYIADEAIGIRIEDDVLVTAESNRVLSDFIPKEIDELESFLQKHR
jgi:Xaa-Pro aminopeptidase